MLTLKTEKISLQCKISPLNKNFIFIGDAPIDCLNYSIKTVNLLTPKNFNSTSHLVTLLVRLDF